MKTAEEILESHLTSMLSRTEDSYVTIEEMKQVPEWEACVKAIEQAQKEAYNQALEDNKEKILTITGEDNPYSLRSVLEHLIWAAKYLLHVKNYDGNRYEELGQCVRRAEEIRKSILKLKK